MEMVPQHAMAPQTSAKVIHPLLLLLPLFLWHPTPASAKWQTLSGQAPVVIANGGDSAVYPDQTDPAYIDALEYSLPGVVISCDLQMAPTLNAYYSATGLGICRTSLNLNDSTDIWLTAPQLNSTRVINGISTLGWFAVDILYENITQNIWAIQSNRARTDVFDNQFSVIDSRRLPYLINYTSKANISTWWLNSEYTRFTEENSKLDATSYLLGLIEGNASLNNSPGYVSVPDIGLLKRIQDAGVANRTKVIYKFLQSQTADASTNQTYQALLQNLTYIKTLASGILVPKSYIWSIDPNTLYLQTPSSLVRDAHNAGLEVYAYNFANDAYPNSYNYSFDAITEILYYIETYNFSVDGFFTDFPRTASEAISCYASNSRNGSLQNNQTVLKKPTVISHNGNSGQLPGATAPAYYSAINAGVDYIDCNVQISNDGIPFCRPTVDLVESTDVSTLFPSYVHTYIGLNDDHAGIYTFDLTWDQIKTLRAEIYSPFEQYIPRDPNFDGEFSIITLAEFLNIARNNSIGVLISIQNAVYIRNNFNLAVVDAVADVLSAAGYNNADTAILMSEDSSALARLRDLHVTSPLMYEILYDKTKPISLNANDFVEIKKYASSVVFSARLVEPLDSNYFLTNPPTDVIALAHEQNLTTFFEVQMNEIDAIADDFEADPTSEVYYLMKAGIDGYVTDFPKTMKRILSNQCLGNNGLTSTVNYSLTNVYPGDFYRLSPQGEPAPLLVVGEPPLLGVQPALAPAPNTTTRASSSRVSAHLLFVALSAFLYVLIECSLENTV